MRSLLASQVRPGDRVLYIGPFGRRFFSAVRHQRPGSTAVRTIHDATLVGRQFDVIVARAVVETLSDTELERWSRRARGLLAIGGRLVIAIRPLGYDTPMGAFQCDSLTDLVDIRRLTDPFSAIVLLQQGGFSVGARLHRWSSAHEVCVLKPTDEPVFALD